MSNRTLFIPPWLQWALIALVAASVGVTVLVSTQLSSKLMPLVLGAVLIPFICFVAGNVRGILTFVFVVDIPIQMDIYLGYVEDPLAIGAINGYVFSVTTIALIILYGQWLLERLNQSSQSTQLTQLTQDSPHASRNKTAAATSDAPKWLRAMLTLPALFFFFNLLSLVSARDVQLATYEVFLLLQVFLMYVYVVVRMKTRDDIRFIFTALLVSLVLEGLVMMLLQVTGRDFTIGPVQARIRGDELGRRIAGTLGAPNGAAGYLSLILPLAYSFWLAPSKKYHRPLAVAAFALGVPALIFTLSRGGWATFVLATAAFVVLAVARRWIKVAPILIAAILASPLLLVFQDTIIKRFTNDDSGSAYSRIPLMRLAWDIIADHPWLGIGINNFSIAMTDYLTPDFNGQWIYIVHNRYMSIWAELGIGGLITFIGFLVAGLYAGWRAYRSQDRAIGVLALGLMAAVMGQISHLSLDVFNGRAQVQSLWLVIALSVALARLDHAEQQLPRQPRPSSSRSSSLLNQAKEARED